MKDQTPALVAYTYTYETAGSPLVTGLTRPDGSMTLYAYKNPLNRLTSLSNKDSAQQVINSYAYTYNTLDLRNKETITNGVSIDNFIEGTVTYTPNNLNQITDSTNPDRTYNYDNDGNMTTGYTPEGYPLTMTYDAENRLISAEYTDSSSVTHRTTYDYSGDSLLSIMKKLDNGVLTKTIRYIRAGFLPIQERNENNVVRRRYLWGLNAGGGIGGLLTLRQGSQDYTYLYDGKGNVTALTDSTQTPVVTYTYDPFGVLMKKTGTLDQPFQFSTKEYDPQTGLSYFGYRFYSPSLGRWINRDPLGEMGGINLYGFVGNNPGNYKDPLGLWTITPRLNLTFFVADVTVGLALDNKGNIGLQLTGAIGLSLSAGITGGVTATNAPCIKSLQGPGTSGGGAANIPGFLPGFEAEVNHVWTGWLNQQNDPAVYKGVDVGVGFGVGLPVTPQVFTGVTGTLFQGRY